VTISDQRINIQEGAGIASMEERSLKVALSAPQPIDTVEVKLDSSIWRHSSASFAASILRLISAANHLTGEGERRRLDDELPEVGRAERASNVAMAVRC
jgi:hypothetical protein